tara:strand:+ start:18001 stop:18441 length:441 start_codon:yes stop_codon:yes gene_type:complete
MFTPLLKESDILELNWEHYEGIAANLSRIDKSSMEDELVELPTVYSYYHGLMIRSKTLCDKMAEKIEVAKSNTRHENRQTGVKVTAIAGEDLVNCNVKIQILVQALISRKEIYSLLKSVCDAIMMKKDMLIQLSANQRQETKLYSA